MNRVIIVTILVLLALVSCEKEKQGKAERGFVIETKQIKIYTPKEIQDFLNIRKFQVPFTLVHNVRAVKIAYMTSGPHGDLVNATGAVYIPETTG